MESKEKRDRMNRFDNFFNIIETIPEGNFENALDAQLFKNPSDDIKCKKIDVLELDEYKQYINKLASGVLNRHNNSYIRFKSALYFYKEMEKIKNFYDSVKEAKLKLMNIMTSPHKDKYAFIKTVMRI